jgi:membrane fusion protein (multidrug efflux system)
VTPVTPWVRTAGATFVLASLIAGCGHGDSSAPAQVAAPPVPVVVQKVGTADVPIVGEYVARTDATQTVDIRVRINGVLQKIFFKDGAAVHAGEQLFQIQPEEYQAALQSAQAQLAKANADYEKARDNVLEESAQANVAVRQSQLDKADRDVARLKPLAEQKAVTQSDLDTAVTTQEVADSSLAQAKASLQDTQLAQRTALAQAKAAVSAAQASVTQAQLNLGYTKISSPLDGVVGFAKVSEGNLVGPSTNAILATVSTIDPIHVKFGVAEADYLFAEKRLEEGAAGEPIALKLILADNTTYPYTGSIVAIDRAVDPKTGTLSVDSSFPNPTGLLRPGLFGRVQMTTRVLKNAVLIPQRAVTLLQDANTVFVVDGNNTVKQRTIVVGDRYQSDYVVTDGLKAGETVVVEGIQKIRAGSTVIPSKAQSAESAPQQ